LTKRLNQLAECGLVIRQTSLENRRPDYRLSTAGQELGPIILGLGEWGMKWARGHAKGDDTPPAFIPFWKRRMLRLYPAYAAAIVFSIVVFGLSGQIRFDLKFIYDIVMHFLLIHNLDMSTTFTISAPLWSLAVEEQLYLLYFILLRMRMKWGWGKTLFVTLGCRAVWMAIGYIAHHKFGLKYFAYDFGIAFWFMWALGAVSVEAWQGTLQLPAWTKNISVGMVLWCLAVGNECFSNLYALPVSIWFQRACEFVEQPLWALAYFVLLNWALQKEEKWKLQDRISRIAQGAALAGVFSYSIYLIHSPIVDNKSEWIIGLADYSFNSDVLMRFIFMVPLAIIVARIFFELFERPFLKEQK